MHDGRRARWAVGGLLALWLAGCGGSSSTSEPTRVGGFVEGQTFQAEGRVVGAQTAGTLTVEHDAIPNVMPAMPMVFSAPNPDAIRGVRTGQRVQVTLQAQNGDLVVVGVEPR